MAQMSNYLETALVNGTLRNTQYTVPATVYLALYSTDPTDADAGVEIAQGNYARQSVVFDAPTDGVTQNTADISFPVATVDYLGNVTHVGIRDALTVGNLLYFAPLATARTIVIGNQFVVSAAQLTVTLA